MNRLSNCLLFFVITIVIAGCSLNILNKNVEYSLMTFDGTFDIKKSGVKSQEENEYQKLSGILLPLSGQLMGLPTSKTYVDFQPSPIGVYSVPVKSLEPLRIESNPLLESWRDAGLNIQPQETKILRIGTFVFDRSSNQYYGSVGLIDSVTGNQLILVYFDRPCRLIGSTELGGMLFIHDITIDKGGFHYLEIKDDGNNRFHILSNNRKNIVRFQITPYNSTNTI